MQRVRHIPPARLALVRVASARALRDRAVADAAAAGRLRRWCTCSLRCSWRASRSTSTRARATTPGARWLINLGQLPYTSNAELPVLLVELPAAVELSRLDSDGVARARAGAGAPRLDALGRLAAAGVLGIAAQRLSGRALAGALAAGFFLASPYVFHTTPLARVNSLALLAAVVGLTLLERPTRRRVLLGSLALLAALFTKPTAIDAVARRRAVGAAAPAAAGRCCRSA